MKKTLALLIPLLLAACTTERRPQTFTSNTPVKKAEKSQDQYFVFPKSRHPECVFDAEIKLGLVDAQGNWTAQPEFSFIKKVSDLIPDHLINGAEAHDLFIATKTPLSYKKKHYEKGSKHCLDPKTLLFGKTLDNLSYGLINHKGEWLLPPSTFNINSITDSTALLTTLNRHFPGRFKLSGPEEGRIKAIRAKLLSQSDNASKSEIRDFEILQEHNLIRVSIVNETASDYSHSFGLADFNGNWILSPQETQQRGYVDISSHHPFNDTNRWITYSKRNHNQICSGFLDNQGKELSEARFVQSVYWDSVTNHKYPFVHMTSCDGKKHGLINQQKQWVFAMPPQYAHLRITDIVSESSFLVVGKNGLHGIMNLKGELEIPVRFTWLAPFDARGYAQAHSEDGTKGFIDRKGNWVFQTENTQQHADLLPNSDIVEINQYSEKEGRHIYSYKNLQGRSIPEPFIDKGIQLVYGFDEKGYGFARKILSNKKQMLNHEGFVNAKGEWLIQPEFAFTRAAISSYPHDESESVQYNQELMLNQPASKYSTSFPLAKFIEPHGLIVASHRDKQNKKGVLNRQGKWVLEPEFNEIYLSEDEPFIIVKNARGWGAYDFNGKQIILP